jgi:hypothetical protein
VAWKYVPLWQDPQFVSKPASLRVENFGDAVSQVGLVILVELISWFRNKALVDFLSLSLSAVLLEQLCNTIKSISMETAFLRNMYSLL